MRAIIFRLITGDSKWTDLKSTITLNKVILHASLMKAMCLIKSPEDKRDSRGNGRNGRWPTKVMNSLRKVNGDIKQIGLKSMIVSKKVI